jgi:hypothetical protein
MDALVKNAHVWERDPHDWYVEPESATAELLTVERFIGDIHDPCCGGGNIVRTLRAGGYHATGTDVVKRVGDDAEWFTGVVDYLDCRCYPSNIVMNPPFFRAKGAEAFIRKALSEASGKVAAFVDIRFIAGDGRATGLFADHPPHRIWVITPRVSCPPGKYLEAGGKAGNGSSDWVWMVWDLTAPKPSSSSLNWLRRAS